MQSANALNRVQDVGSSTFTCKCIVSYNRYECIVAVLDRREHIVIYHADPLLRQTTAHHSYTVLLSSLFAYYQLEHERDVNVGLVSATAD